MSAPEAEQRGVTVRAECAADLPEINADPGMLQQAVLNLALNACQAMPNGGTLKLSCRTAPRRRVEIDVEDTGVGIPPENLGRIFDLYFTTKDTGTGIGLSMVYRIVQLHDGEVRSSPRPATEPGSVWCSRRRRLAGEPRARQLRGLTTTHMYRALLLAALTLPAAACASAQAKAPIEPCRSKCRPCRRGWSTRGDRSATAPPPEAPIRLRAGDRTEVAAARTAIGRKRARIRSRSRRAGAGRSRPSRRRCRRCARRRRPTARRGEAPDHEIIGSARRQLLDGDGYPPAERRSAGELRERKDSLLPPKTALKASNLVLAPGSTPVRAENIAKLLGRTRNS